ncbi:uncharacterized protein LOC122081603 isoform X2 [Macadamia integrifolia]|uniref:uncharacterized protein LOC122081603 isoform X2 n=1 Tax=Macadamia integrifolia TaxID=60698 RepID=UPI001C4FAC13|nr:uncharacterized protein LOC122081603 isoform X2 [Macadamia integrifolia]
MRRNQDEQSRVFSELCALIFSLLRSPPIPISNPSSGMAPSATPLRRRSISQVSPAAFASLLLGISLSLMLCGSVTFVIGFILMPWVLGMVMFFYFVGIVSNLSVLGRSILCPTATSALSRKEVHAWNFL